LADAVGSVHGLEVHLRVEVAVEQYDCVGTGQVDAQPAGPGRKQKHELLTVGGTELVDLGFSDQCAGAAVNSAILVLALDAVVFEDV